MYNGGIIYTSATWISRLAFLNLLWICFSIFGLVVFGFFPAVVAMLAIERKWIRGEKDVTILKTFWLEFKQNFITANIIGYSLVVACFLIYLNMTLVSSLNNWMEPLLLFILYGFAFLFAILAIYIFPAFVHYQARLIDYFLHGVMIALISPVHSLFILINVIAFFFIGYFFPGIICVYLGSGITFIVMWFAYQSIQKIENKIAVEKRRNIVHDR
ncbi:YesL family protein [Gracilibacillus dipsosauri]|uniref:DUF624 domain-containing protein n=1 Tax=Gracilibacillus dipsosauri TaxID=178340 RepID=A0A317KUG5_9BACI|nr:DUF624 domain-containing protein [Gracilibacillus dipsosauri]PWU67191.1 hypothetical protein DLJ74_16595 [Gracilibacillus dipsosauri]